MKELKINVPEGYEIDKDKSTFENIVFKEKNELPKSWEDLQVISGFVVTEYSNTYEFGDVKAERAHRNVFKTKEQAEASIALAKLSQLRDVYRQGWEPDWNDETSKYCIVFYDSLPYVDDYSNYQKFLSFQDKQTAVLFLENFRDLIEQAKPLMS